MPNTARHSTNNNSISNHYQIPDIIHIQDHIAAFHKLCCDCLSPSVDLADLEPARDIVLRAFVSEDSQHVPSLAILHGRYLGKYLLLALASLLSRSLVEHHLDDSTAVILISFHGTTPFSNAVEDDALSALLARVAFVLSGESTSFSSFLRRRVNEQWWNVQQFLMDASVILLIEGLDMIPATAKRYDGMCSFLLNGIQDKAGSVVVYSTPALNTADLLLAHGQDIYNVAVRRNVLSDRRHRWLDTPRIEM